jgi:serine/threonine-protein kinase
MGAITTSGPAIPGYELIEKIGEGPVGEVFLATELSLDREVAIKVLRPELASRSGVADLFLMQARKLAGLNHPNIATVYTVFCDGPIVLVVTEYVEGWPITATSRSTGGLSARHVLPIFQQALDGVGFAHSSGVLHLGIKPSNLMVTSAGTVKVMDFGVSRCIGPGDERRRGTTVQCMSPGPPSGTETDPRSDIYSLGFLLYEMLVGHMPFDRRDCAPEDLPPALGQGIPESLEKVVMRALEATPERCFASIEEFCSAIEATLPEVAPGDPIGQGIFIVAEPINPLLRAGGDQCLDDNAEETTQVLGAEATLSRTERPRRERATSLTLGLALLGLVALAALGLQFVTRSPEEVDAADRTAQAATAVRPLPVTAPWAEVPAAPPDPPRATKPKTRRVRRPVTKERSKPAAKQTESEEWVIRRR